MKIKMELILKNKNIIKFNKINNNYIPQNNQQNNQLFNCNVINDSYDIDSMIINKINSFSTRKNNNTNNTINQCLNIIDNEDNNLENNNIITNNVRKEKNINVEFNNNNIQSNNEIDIIKDEELKLKNLSKK